MHQAVVPDWGNAPQVPRVGARDLDIWRIRLDTPDSAPLTAPRTQARSAMRAILARYLARPPDSLAFGRHPGGKPYLAAEAQPLEFNLSHTQGMALLAVAMRRPVGIDIEAVRPVGDPLRLARRIMDEESITALQATTGTEQRLRLFIDLWTRLEACQKTHGRGIFAPAVSQAHMQSFGFRIDEAWRACVATTASPDQPDMHFYRFETS